MPLASGLLDRGRGLTSDLFAPASDGMRDHVVKAYVAAWEKSRPQPALP